MGKKLVYLLEKRDDINIVPLKAGEISGAMNSSRISAAIAIPEDFSKDIEENKNIWVDFYSDSINETTEKFNQDINEYVATLNMISISSNDIAGVSGKAYHDIQDSIFKKEITIWLYKFSMIKYNCYVENKEGDSYMKKATILLIALITMVSSFTGCSAKKTAVIKTKSNLAGKIVGVQLGSSSEEALNSDKDVVKSLKEIRKYQDNTQALMDLSNGNIDAVVVDEVVGRYYISKKADQYEILNDNFGEESYGVGIRKQDTEFKAALDKALDDMKKDGTADKISEKWFGKAIVEKDNQAVQAVAGDGTLNGIRTKGKFVVGLDDSFPPMGFRDQDGQIVGFDIDLAKEAAKRLGVEVEFKPVEWDGVLMSLKNGDIDVIWNGLTITDARKKEIDFSKVYLKNRQIIVVRKQK